MGQAGVGQPAFRLVDSVNHLGGGGGVGEALRLVCDRLVWDSLPLSSWRWSITWGEGGGGRVRDWCGTASLRLVEGVEGVDERGGAGERSPRARVSLEQAGGCQSGRRGGVGASPPRTRHMPPPPRTRHMAPPPRTRHMSPPPRTRHKPSPPRIRHMPPPPAQGTCPHPPHLTGIIVTPVLAGRGVREIHAAPMSQHDAWRGEGGGGVREVHAAPMSQHNAWRGGGGGRGQGE